jgi:hypothetical protein
VVLEFEFGASCSPSWTTLPALLSLRLPCQLVMSSPSTLTICRLSEDPPVTQQRQIPTKCFTSWVTQLIPCKDSVSYMLPTCKEDRKQWQDWLSEKGQLTWVSWFSPLVSKPWWRTQDKFNLCAVHTQLWDTAKTLYHVEMWELSESFCKNSVQNSTGARVYHL